MALVPTNQNLIRDVAALLQTRGLRLASHKQEFDSTLTNSDYFLVYTQVTGGAALSAPAAGTQRIIIDMKTSKLTEMDEKGWGSLHPHVPSTSRL